MGVFDGITKALGQQTQPAALSVQEESRLDELKRIITDGIRGWFAAGKALQEIKAKQLYRRDYATFEIFASAEFRLSENRLRQIIDATQFLESVVAQLPEAATPTLPTERTIRELKTIPKAERVEVYAEAVAVESQAAGKPTAPSVKTVRESVAKRAAKAGRKARHKPQTFRLPGCSVRITWNAAGSGDAEQAARDLLAAIETRKAKAA
jgi:hypothetical protein